VVYTMQFGHYAPVPEGDLAGIVQT